MRAWALIMTLIPGTAFCLPSGENMLPAKGQAALALAGNAALGKLGPSAAPGPGGPALTLETLTQGENPWSVQAQLALAKPMRKGDRLSLSFWARALKSRQESGEALSVVIVELSREPWLKTAEFPLRAGREWKQYFVRFEASQDFGVGDANLNFRIGFAPQTFELSGLSLMNYGREVELKNLPVTRIDYKGREANSPWRREAEARIAKLRTAPLTVLVTDSAGKPIPGAKVELAQTANAFGFGACVSGLYRSKAAPQARAKYDQLFLRNFNAAVEENSFKWVALDGDWGKDYSLGLAMATANWAKDAGLLFRGHVLLWPSWRNMPKMMKKYEKDKTALRERTLAHVRLLAARTKGLTDHWDVVNEPFDNHDLQDILGEDILVDAFKAARAARPDGLHFINDYAILPGGPGDTPHRKHYEQTLRMLVAKGAPFDGVGMQGHFGSSLSDPEVLLQILDRYAAAAPGKQIWVTEYDAETGDEDLEGDYLRDLLTVLYSHPAVGGFMMWGFWDGAHWHHRAPLYREDWSPKPAAAQWQTLVLDRWKTKASGVSDAGGVFSKAGHLGEYRVLVTAGGKKAEMETTLKAGGTKLTVALK